MKIKAEDAVELAMDWLAQLHDDGRAESQGDAGDRPAVAPPPAVAALPPAVALPPAAVAAPPAVALPPAAALPPAVALPPVGVALPPAAVEPPPEAAPRPAVATLPPAANSSGGVETSAAAEMTERAPIGDELRIPIAWCEMGSCISYYADPLALGEADIRARAIVAGWRVDALNRLACPKCQQSVSWFWTASPVVQWDRDRAVATASLMAAAVYEDATSDGMAGPDTGEIPSVRPASSPCPARGRHRTRRRRSRRAADQAAAQGSGRPLYVRGDYPV